MRFYSPSRITRVLSRGVYGLMGGGVAGALLWLPSCGLTTADQANRVFIACVVLGAVGAIIYGFIVELIEERKSNEWREQRYEEERQARLREERAELETHRKAQEELRQGLVQVVDMALKHFESLPNELLEAESLLNTAERDFDEHAFAPFWDAIEEATRCLCRFNDNVAAIGYCLASHSKYATGYEGPPPKFPIAMESVKAMAAGNATTDRLRMIVRKAQTDFQFATIYEQRKTNQILMAGFTSLGQALDGMSQRISSSIDRLSNQVSEMSDSLSSAITALGEGMSDALQEVSDSVGELSASIQQDSRVREEGYEQALDMLDNIQRRRMPIEYSPIKRLTTKPAP